MSAPARAAARQPRPYVVVLDRDPWASSAGPWALYGGPRLPRGEKVRSMSRHWTQAEACDEAARRLTMQWARVQDLAVEHHAGREMPVVLLNTTVTPPVRMPFRSWWDAATFLEARRVQREAVKAMGHAA